MTMIKRGMISSKMIVSSSVWVCPICGCSKIQTEEHDSIEKCPEDGIDMRLISSSWGTHRTKTSALTD